MIKVEDGTVIVNGKGADILAEIGLLIHSVSEGTGVPASRLLVSLFLALAELDENEED